jgi:TonB family protein
LSLIGRLAFQLPIKTLNKCLWPKEICRLNNCIRVATSVSAGTSDSTTMSGVSKRVRGAVRAGGVLAGCGVVCCVLAWCSPTFPVRVRPLQTPLSNSERQLARVPAHISEFNTVSEPLALPKCGDVRPPEALLTPDPLLPAQEDDDVPVRVSFIVGSDGHVHSAFVLNGAGPDEDAAVLRAVRQWRYRPALCNGVPTDSEARVRFTLR